MIKNHAGIHDAIIKNLVGLGGKLQSAGLLGSAVDVQNVSTQEVVDSVTTKVAEDSRNFHSFIEILQTDSYTLGIAEYLKQESEF